jgi:hypothetical protein
MQPCFMRLFYLLAGWISVGICYRSAAELQGKPTHLASSMIDRWSRMATFIQTIKGVTVC